MNFDDRTSIIDIIESLNYHTMKYNEGKPEISDKEWDAMYFTLKDLEKQTGIVLSNSPTQRVHYIVDKQNKVKHNHPMLSLDKTKDENDIVKFVDNKNCLVSLKMDGLSLLLTYESGKILRAETRGDGEYGKDVTYLVSAFKNIPMEIEYKEHFEIEGEAIISYEDFSKFEGVYKNPRNLAAGTLSLLDNKEAAERGLQFIAWKVCTDKYPTFLDRLDFASELGFDVVPSYFLTSEHSFEEAKKELLNIAEALSFPIDGLVVTYNDIKYGESLGYTAHHPKHSLAFKLYDEEYETTLTDIEWSMGRTGQLTPVAIFEPVDIDGTEVSRASLHNLSIMKSLYPEQWHSGLGLKVYKANMIIPQVSSVFFKEGSCAKRVDCPVCPVCGEPTTIRDNDGVKTLWCENPLCDGKLVNQLDHYASKKGLDIKGLSKMTLASLIDWGWVGNIHEIYSLCNFRNDWIKKPGFGEKSVDNILNAIEESKKCSFPQFIAALGIPLIGLSVAKEINKHVKTYEEFRKLIEDKFDFSVWDTFGSEKSNSLLKFDYTYADRISDLLTFEQAPEASNQSLANLTFVITGKLAAGSRDKFKSAIEKAGGKVASAVSSKTNYLINNDKDSKTSKNLKAIELKVEIITEKEFFERFNIKLE